jgi:tryptophan synthase alpha chain
MPLILMGYLNPVLRMGMESFLSRCMDAGIDGVIIPDLPPDEYEKDYRDMFKRFGIYHSLLVTPHTSEERIRRIAALSDGFLYMVAASSTTGTRDSVGDQQRQYFQRMQEMSLPVPGLIGFGISNRETFETACKYARGAIIGSAFIKALGAAGSQSLEALVRDFIAHIRGEPTGSD